MSVLATRIDERSDAFSRNREAMTVLVEDLRAAPADRRPSSGIASAAN
jgi:hypothetical protein